jgi:hypothetical protein
MWDSFIIRFCKVDVMCFEGEPNWLGILVLAIFGTGLWMGLMVMLENK